jgi:hypothetical protein
MVQIYGRKETLTAIDNERKAQDERWGVQSHPDGTDCSVYGPKAARLKSLCNFLDQQGVVDWATILQEEVMEALAETDPQRLHDELIQVAAVAVAWCEDLQRRVRGG